ncbi:MAG TPA: EAL domain-containing protein [Candidatus Limnocylindria bacterium]|nr:EAL domain-containing protein [Candidatus Limnocylindria bacterium]
MTGPHLPYLRGPTQPGGTTGSSALEQHIPSTAIRGLSTGALTRRMLMGAVLAVLAFAGAFQVATTLADADLALAVIFGSGAALVVGAAVMSRTISPIVAGQQELQVRYEAALADALRDPLTRLGNHRAFHEELDRQVEAALRYGTPLALMLIDLDEFKAINDRQGHAGGDRILRGFGELLSSTLRRADRAYRVGGDEFAVILPHTDLEGAKIVGRRVLAQALQPALRLEDLQPVSFSCGISALPEMAATRTQLFSQADAALYAAKRNGRTEVVSYDPSVDAAGEPASGTAAVAISEVIARGQLRPVYQPIVSLASGTVIGVEGLIRPVPPAPFADPGALFEAAEAGGRLTALDLACVETIVAGAGDLPEDQFLSLNLSPPTVESPEFTSAALLAILARHGFPRNRLVVELTERQAIHDVERVRSRLEALREAGVRIAADDIGAGNSGLRLLAEISFDVLKVDLGLVQRSASSESSTAVLGSVVALASRMGALVIAEGIEQASQLAQLSQLGIEAGQGFHLGRPGPIEAATPVLEPVAVEMSAWRESLGLPSAS